MVENISNYNDFIYGIAFAGFFLIIGIIIQIVGSLFADSLNHKRRLQYLEKEEFFKKKIEFLMKLSEELENQLSILLAIHREINHDKIDSKKVFSLITQLPLATKDTDKPFFLGYSLFINRKLVLEIRSLRSEINASFMESCNKILEETDKEKKKIEIKKLDHVFDKGVKNFNDMIDIIKKEL